MRSLYMGGTHKGNNSSKRNRTSPESVTNTTKKMSLDQSAMINGITELTEAIKGLAQRMDSMENTFLEKLGEVTALMEEKERKWQIEKKELVARSNDLENRIDQLERRERRNNVIITGVSANRDNCKQVVNQLFAQVSDSVRVVEATCLSSQKEGRILARFGSFEDKLSIIKNKKALVRIDENGINRQIFINDDLTKKDQEISFHARKFAKRMKDEGKDARLGFRKVFVDGQLFLWEEDSKTFINKKN